MKKRRRGRGGREGQWMTGKDEAKEMEKEKEKEQEQQEEEFSLSSSSRICVLICRIPIFFKFLII